MPINPFELIHMSLQSAKHTTLVTDAHSAADILAHRWLCLRVQCRIQLFCPGILQHAGFEVGGLITDPSISGRLLYQLSHICPTVTTTSLFLLWKNWGFNENLLKCWRPKYQFSTDLCSKKRHIAAGNCYRVPHPQNVTSFITLIPQQNPYQYPIR